MQRITVVGTTGSGKTMLAHHLAQRLGVPHIELDALHWGPNWSEAPREVFRERVAAALAGDAWVVDGNYGKVRDIVWSRAETIVWLDFPLSLILWRLLVRTVRRVFTREELWSGNRERIRTAFFSRESLFVWALQTYWRRKRDYPELLRHTEYNHLTLVHLTSPSQARRWFEGLPGQSQT